MHSNMVDLKQQVSSLRFYKAIWVGGGGGGAAVCTITRRCMLNSAVILLEHAMQASRAPVYSPPPPWC